MGEFRGFPEGGLRFLDELALNNNKEWFEAHRREFEGYLLEPGKSFVAELGPRLRQHISPAIHAEPKVNGSIMRMNRDIRFSKDKSPYKTWFGLWFWEGERRSMECSGFYLGLSGDGVSLGAGKHGFEPDLLERYRNAVVDPKLGADLERAIDEVKQSGDYEIHGRYYKQVPRGFDRDHARADLLLYNGLHATASVGEPVELQTPAFVDFTLRHYTALAPVHRWLVGLTEQQPTGT